MAAVLAVTAVSFARPDDRLAALLDKSAAYLERLERECTTIIADEEYRQRWIRGRLPSGLDLAEDRLLRSEMLFVWVPVDREWLAVRDVKLLTGAQCQTRNGLCLLKSPLSLHQLHSARLG